MFVFFVLLPREPRHVEGRRGRCVKVAGGRNVGESDHSNYHVAIITSRYNFRVFRLSRRSHSMDLVTGTARNLHLLPLLSPFSPIFFLPLSPPDNNLNHQATQLRSPIPLEMAGMPGPDPVPRRVTRLHGPSFSPTGQVFPITRFATDRQQFEIANSIYCTPC
jgi:hypothetical protein